MRPPIAFQLSFPEPSRATAREIRARWMRDHQIPLQVQQIAEIALDVSGRIAFGWQQITAPCLMLMTKKCIANDATELAGDEYSCNKPWGYSGNVTRTPEAGRTAFATSAGVIVWALKDRDDSNA